MTISINKRAGVAEVATEYWWGWQEQHFNCNNYSTAVLCVILQGIHASF